MSCAFHAVWPALKIIALLFVDKITHQPGKSEFVLSSQLFAKFWIPVATSHPENERESDLAKKEGSHKVSFKDGMPRCQSWDTPIIFKDIPRFGHSFWWLLCPYIFSLFHRQHGIPRSPGGKGALTVNEFVGIPSGLRFEQQQSGIFGRLSVVVLLVEIVVFLWI